MQFAVTQPWIFQRQQTQAHTAAASSVEGFHKCLLRSSRAYLGKLPSAPHETQNEGVVFPQINAAMHAAAENLRRQQPSLFKSDGAVLAARAGAGNGAGVSGAEADATAVLAARVESLEREVRVGMAVRCVAC